MSAGSRADRLAALAAESELDCLFVGDLVRPGDSGPDAIANIRWLTGFTGSSGFAIVGEARREFFTDFRYTERAAAEVSGEFDRVTLQGRLVAELAKRFAGRVGYDEDATSVASLRKLEEAMPDGASLVAATGLVEKLRRRKDAQEIEAIAEASRLADEVFEWLAGRGLAGKTERDVAQAAEQRMRELGAEPSFPAIVGSGPNGALPHAEPGDRLIGDGKLVVVDMGAKLAGYCSDGTRTWATGEIAGDAREAYELVLRAQEQSLGAIKAGVAGAEADRVSRDPIVEAGKGDLYGHGLGHGVGLEVHEAPRLGKTSEDVLQEGDVVTVEPGVYVPGRFGVRIEDLVVVEASGVRNLSATPKELRVTG
ncbi:MAG: aminopeptidase P family protein [Actinomycetota bacterium]|nr:aminopeptidase P family protein [Actinomycetota bacterium]